MLARRADEVISRYFEEAQRSPARKRGRDLGYELLTQGTRDTIAKRELSDIISSAVDRPAAGIQMKVGVAITTLGLLLTAIPISAQTQNEDWVVRPKKVENPPKIDGLLDEPLWDEIEPITDFRQYEPDNRALPTENTEVRICYDSRFLYFGIRAYDGEPNKIIARVFERDRMVDDDDSFTVAIDSLNDNRNGVLFDSNTLGTKRDVQYTEKGNYNGSWDSVWYTKGNIDDLGFTMEIAIPFFVLRFKPTEDVEMGLYLERVNRRKNETTCWPHLTRDFNYRSVSQYGRMVGLHGIERGVDLEVKPYGIGGYSETPVDSDRVVDAGIDVKWGLTSNLTTDLTLNPDFAQVESDALQVNLTRFSLFYPEKREFFLENTGLFQFGLARTAEVFFSRRIGIREGREVPILGGARVYGLMGNTNLGVMTMQTRDSGGFGGENFSVARVKHNIFGRSYVGGIATSRRGAELEDTTLGGDFMFLFGRNFKVNGSLARSARSARSERPGGDEAYWMANFGVNHDTDLYNWTVRYDDIDPDFDPGIGFIARPDQRAVFADANYKPRPGWKGVRQLTMGAFFQRIENHDGVVETLYWSPAFRVGFQSEAWISAAYDDIFDYVPFSFPVAPGVVIPSGEYRNHQGIVSFRTGRAGRVVLSGFFRAGSYYGGNFTRTNLVLMVQPIPQLHLNADNSLDKVDLPGGSFDSLISRLSVSYYFSPALTTRLTAQYSSLLEDFIFNFRLRWIYAPRSEVWLVYDEGRRFGLLEPSLRDRALIAKIVHNFSF